MTPEARLIAWAVTLAATGIALIAAAAITAGHEHKEEGK
jgi:hypothetical protein